MSKLRWGYGKLRPARGLCRARAGVHVCVGGEAAWDVSAWRDPDAAGVVRL